MFVQEEDVFGFKSFDETFEVKDKLASLEKYSNAAVSRIRKEIPNVKFYYNFHFLGEFKFLLLENGISIDSGVKSLSFVNIQEISVKIDPDSQDELLNLKLDSAVYVQFKFSLKEFQVLKNILKLDNLQATLQVEHVTIENQDPERESKETLYETKLKRLTDKKLKLELELRDIDLELQNLKEYNVLEKECTLCYDSIVSKRLIPCGHVICGNCLNKLNDQSCPWDRLKINLIKEIS